MKVLISHSYFLKYDPKEEKNHKPFPPLAPLYLSALIKQELNFDIEFYDVMFDVDWTGLAKKINNYEPDVLIVYDDDFNYLTKMCLENMREAILKTLVNINKTGLFVVHGSDASDNSEKYLRAGFDFVVNQNAEKIILEILNLFVEKKPDLIKNLESVSFLDDQSLVTNQKAKTNFPLQNMPLPSWQIINLNPYKKEWMKHHNYFAINVSTSHGCPYKCNWCAKPLYGRTYKVITPQKVAEHFYYLKHSIQAEFIWVTDDIFALKPGWLKEFADELEKIKTKIPYKIQSRADLINEEYVRGLSKSGCTEVWLGVESGSQKILDAMDKELQVNQTFEATALLKKYNIKVAYFLQYGYPGEEYEDIKETLALIKKGKPDHIGISVTYPLKNTPFYNRVVNEMKEKQNWTDSGDLALMYQGKYKPDFYRKLHKFTHHYFGFYSLFKKQSFKKRFRRLAAQYKHLPGLLSNRIAMQKYL
jgi:radical SAM superfamily enzyme YgiQ (UPF0313 family)